MTNPTQPKAIPIPALLVFGKPTGPDFPQASWFRIEDREAVTSAAQSLNFFVIEIQTHDERALAVGVHEGVLKGSGRMIVGSVAPDVYRSIEEHVRKTAGAAAAKTKDDEHAGAKPLSEQTVNLVDTGAPAPAAANATPVAPDGKIKATAALPSSNKPEPMPPRDPWDGLRIGSYVVGKCWEKDGNALVLLSQKAAGGKRRRLS